MATSEIPMASIDHNDQNGHPAQQRADNHPPQKILGIIPHEIHGKLPGGINYQFSPIVMFFSVAIIWGFVIWCAADRENALDVLGEVQAFVVRYFGWLYIVALIIMFCFCMYAAFSKYGDIKLGPENEPPTYSLVTWFSMLFSAGIGVGLYYFGVAEPVWHFNDMQNGTSRWYHLTRNQQAMEAMNVSWFHWGFTASACYCAAALPLAYHHHVKGEPLRESTCFSALIGQKYAEGFIGCLIDLSSVIGTMFGVATSLGLGVLSINAGLDYIFGLGQSLGAQLCIIWVVTALATISVLSGLDVGIRRLSEINFAFSFIVLFFLFFALDPFFIINLFIQGTGYHFQWILQLTFDTSAFEQCGFSELHETDPDAHDAQVSWMAGWTIFYWAWWIAWAPAVGVFIAQISRGRTIREFVIGNMLVPTLLTCIWLVIFGGVGLYMELASIQNGVECSDCYAEDEVNETTTMWSTTEDGEEVCDQSKWYSEYAGHTVVRLSCFGSAPEVLYAAYSALPLSKAITTISLIGIVTYFVTSSDSASHVIDILTAGGNVEAPKIQRLFWAISEGAVASVLLAAAGGDTTSLTALQTASLVAALPFTVVLLFEVMATYKTLLIHCGELNLDEQVYWTFDLFEVGTKCPNLLLGLLCPPYYQMKARMNIIEHFEKRSKGGKYEGANGTDMETEEMDDFLWHNDGFEDNAFKYIWICGYWIFWGISALFLLIGAIFGTFNVGVDGFVELGLVFYCFYLILSIGNRNLIKSYYEINSSHIIFDFCSWTFCWCCAVVQEELQSENDVDLKDVNLMASSSVMPSEMRTNTYKQEVEIAEEEPQKAYVSSEPADDTTDAVKKVDDETINNDDAPKDDKDGEVFQD